MLVTQISPSGTGHIELGTSEYREKLKKKINGNHLDKRVETK